MQIHPTEFAWSPLEHVMKGCRLILFSLLLGSTAAQMPRNPDIDTPALYEVPSTAVVSASDLAVPSRARKELRVANELLARQDYQHALKRLTNAIEIYPAFAVAYNNMAVVYAHVGDRKREREAVEEAIRLDSRLALAHLNLARLQISSGEFSAAEKELQKAAALNPLEPVALILLDYTELMEGHLADAILTSQKAHELRMPHAFAHRLAARALEQQNDWQGAITELEICINEEPSGNRADSARKELAILHALTSKARDANKAKAP
jgi:tetratricopeptide (TPR) repeat protein